MRLIKRNERHMNVAKRGYYRCAMLFKYFTFFAFILFSVIPAQAAQSPDVKPNHGDSSLQYKDYNCIVCHKEMDDESLTPPVDKWMKSVHREVGVKCADCHGGNPADEDMAMDEEAGFKGAPEPKDIPAFCAKCHSDAKLMRSYNQRADQYTLYSGSVHGRRLKAGNENAPSCVSCHGAHKILRVKDPDSSVSRRAIPVTCGNCHSKQKIFEKLGKPWNQLSLYKKSKHYKLFAEGDLLTPTCVDCHGNHSILPATSERTRTVCFNCHSQQAEYYKASPHWKIYKKEGEPICLNCHNSHDILHPTADKFTGDEDNDCAGCHDEGSDAYKSAKKIQSSVNLATALVKRADMLLAGFKKGAHGGFEISGLEERLSKVKDNLKELLALTHKINIDEVSITSKNIVKAAQGITADVKSMLSELKVRRLGLVIGWVVFFGFTVALWQKSKSLEWRG